MTKVTGPTDPNTIILIRKLKDVAREKDSTVFNRVADILSKPRRNRPEVNISSLNRYSKKGDTVIIPGKLLGTGSLDHAVTVAAVSFSENAKEKIENQGGKVITILDLLSSNPSGKNVLLLG